MTHVYIVTLQYMVTNDQKMVLNLSEIIFGLYSIVNHYHYLPNEAFIFGIAVSNRGFLFREKVFAVSRKPDVDRHFFAVLQLQSETVDKVDLVGAESQIIEFIPGMFRRCCSHFKMIFIECKSFLNFFFIE